MNYPWYFNLLFNFIVTEMKEDTVHSNTMQLVEKEICTPVEVTR